MARPQRVEAREDERRRGTRRAPRVSWLERTGRVAETSWEPMRAAAAPSRCHFQLLKSLAGATPRQVESSAPARAGGLARADCAPAFGNARARQSSRSLRRALRPSLCLRARAGRRL